MSPGAKTGTSTGCSRSATAPRPSRGSGGSSLGSRSAPALSIPAKRTRSGASRSASPLAFLTRHGQPRSQNSILRRMLCRARRRSLISLRSTFGRSSTPELSKTATTCACSSRSVSRGTFFLRRRGAWTRLPAASTDSRTKTSTKRAGKSAPALSREWDE